MKRAVLIAAVVVAAGGATFVALRHRGGHYALCATRCSDGSWCSEDAGGWKRVVPPAIPGFDVKHADFDAESGVALATDAQQRVVLMGFERAAPAVRWTANLAGSPADEPDPARIPHVLALGKWVGVYGTPGRVEHAVAFDAQSGHRVWDRELDASRRVTGLRLEDKLLFLDTTGTAAPIVLDVMTGRSRR